MYDIRCSDDKRIFNIHTDGIPHLSVDMLDSLGVPNLFTTRFISYDPETGTGQKGLRLAVMHDEDIAEASPVCRKNRDILAHQLGSSISMECITDQKHTNYVHVASREDLGIPTVGNFALHRHYVDGVVTDIPDVLLTAFGGDCPPVYIADPVRKAIGLVHARDCYEMGNEVYDLFAEEWSEADAEKIFAKYPAHDAQGRDIPGGKYHLDLREANRMSLLKAGIPADHISVSNICTRCNSDTFYSYRSGHMENEQVAMMVNRFGGSI